MPSNLTTQTKGKLTVGQALANAAALALGIVGTLFYTNLTSTQKYVTVQALQEVAYAVMTQTGSTATGGVKSGGQGNYNAIEIVSPMSSANAAANGLATGTGTITEVYIDPVAPQVGGNIACSVHNSNLRGTGGTLILSRVLQTGAIIMNLTGAYVMGPHQSFRCSLGNSPSASSDIRVLLKIVPSRVVN